MKVIRQGVLQSDGSNVQLREWWFNHEDKPWTTHDLLCAALIHIAQVHGIELVVAEAELRVPQRLALDCERAALDAIALARWVPLEGCDP